MSSAGEGLVVVRRVETQKQKDTMKGNRFPKGGIKRRSKKSFRTTSAKLKKKRWPSSQ